MVLTEDCLWYGNYRGVFLGWYLQWSVEGTVLTGDCWCGVTDSGVLMGCLYQGSFGWMILTGKCCWHVNYRDCWWDGTDFWIVVLVG
jgi:hypothetical protein